jgi:hypothetical protein
MHYSLDGYAADLEVFWLDSVTGNIYLRRSLMTDNNAFQHYTVSVPNPLATLS